jgi:hypothetical protein
MLKLKKTFFDRCTYKNILNWIEYEDARLLVLLLFEQPSYKVFEPNYMSIKMEAIIEV